jgi:hypothetical protein
VQQRLQPQPNSQIEAGHTLTSGAPAGDPVVYGLARTGVRSVTLYYPRRKPQTVLAINNVFILHNPRQKLPRNGLPDKLVWRGTAGQLIKTIADLRAIAMRPQRTAGGVPARNARGGWRRLRRSGDRNLRPSALRSR